jgi:hypothetical protein
MTAHEFGDILHQMIQNRYFINDNMSIWLEMIHRLNGDPEHTIWTLRYGGKTIGSPLKRHLNDLAAAKNKSHTWFSHFLKIIQADFPWIADRAQVEEVVKATTPGVDAPDILDLREQVLIALLGVGSLNIQAGGSDVVGWITKEDESVFSALKTNNSAALATLQKCPDSMRAEIEHYAADAQQYAIDHSESTGLSSTRKFTQTVRDSLVRQAVPAVGHLNCSLMTIVASDIGQDSNGESTFFDETRRSANTVKKCYDVLLHWEKLSASSFTPGGTRDLANKGYLPFVDVFPWFKASVDDYPPAGKLLLQYLHTTKPLILLAYGQTPAFFALSSFEEVTAKFYFKTQRTQNDRGCNSFIEQLGRPKLCKLGTDGDEVVVIPSYHPGFPAQAGGVVAPSAMKLFFLVQQIAWYAMHVALQCDAKSMSRGKSCKKIIAKITRILDTKHTFGEFFAKSVNEACIINKAFNDERGLRMKLARQDKPDWAAYPQNILISTSTEQSTAYGLLFREHRVDEDEGPKGRLGKHIQYIMSWFEPSLEDPEAEELWTVGPLNLSEDIPTTQTQTAPQYVLYTKEGLDILDDTGTSLGKREPMLSGTGKSCTLSISMIVLLGSIKDDDDQKFLRHWEKRTGQNIDHYMLASLTGAVPIPSRWDPYIHSSFFDVSPTQRALPVPFFKIFQKQKKDWYVKFIKTTLAPVNPGDMIWLFAKLLHEICNAEEGVTFNVADPSESPLSIYLHIARFCSKKEYRAHPHWRSLLALAHLSGVDMADRLYANNVVHIAVEALAVNSSKTKRVIVWIQGTRYERTVMTYTIDDSEAFYEDKIAPYNEPDLIHDAEPKEIDAEGPEDDDLSDKEADKKTEKRSRRELSSESSDYITSKTKKGKGKMVPKVPDTPEGLEDDDSSDEADKKTEKRSRRELSSESSDYATSTTKKGKGKAAPTVSDIPEEKVRSKSKLKRQNRRSTPPNMSTNAANIATAQWPPFGGASGARASQGGSSSGPARGGSSGSATQGGFSSGPARGGSSGGTPRGGGSSGGPARGGSSGGPVRGGSGSTPRGGSGSTPRGGSSSTPRGGSSGGPAHGGSSGGPVRGGSSGGSVRGGPGGSVRGRPGRGRSGRSGRG